MYTSSKRRKRRWKMNCHLRKHDKTIDKTQAHLPAWRAARRESTANRRKHNRIYCRRDARKNKWQQKLFPGCMLIIPVNAHLLSSFFPKALSRLSQVRNHGNQFVTLPLEAVPVAVCACCVRGFDKCTLVRASATLTPLQDGPPWDVTF